MPEADFDVAVIGAGVAGLAALKELARAGLRVICIEARDRIGGRVFTIHDRQSALPIELGAEFVHGRPREVWQIVRAASLAAYDCEDSATRVEKGMPRQLTNVWDAVGEVMQDMRRAAAEGADQPFATFLESARHSAEAKKLSSSFVEGFNAARKEIIGVASLAQDAAAADEIQGDRSFRLLNGYDAISEQLFREIEEGSSKVRLHTVLRKVEWRPGKVSLTTSSALTGRSEVFSARRLVITVPLGVLQATSGDGSIEWSPEPREILEAARALAFGQVARVVFRFRERFWEEISEFADAGFILSDEQVFPTWWSSLPVRAPILTAWSSGPHADALRGLERPAVIGKAISTLARILSLSESQIQNQIQHAYWHDWLADPFCRGAYSYVPAGALEARKALATPLSDTLYCAGEATELNGHSATVHGAIASGLRAARQIILREG